MKIFYFLLLTGMALTSATSQKSVQASTAVQPQITKIPDVFVRDTPEQAVSVYLADAISGSEPSDDKKKDPGYKLYKEAYNLVLDEKWDEARKKFSEMKAQYPKSDYVDDAEYWSAYALEHLEKDKGKAYKAFKGFIFNYPNSNYYDDAVAEMFKLDGGNVVAGKSGSNVYVREGATAISVDKNGAVYKEPDGKGGYRFRYEVIPALRQNTRTLRQLGHQMSLMKSTIGRPVPVPDATTIGTSAPTLAPGSWYSDETLDPETKLKMDALYALGNSKVDSLSFMALRDVAVDPKQSPVLRKTAMDALVNYINYKKFDVLSVYLEVAKRDTSEDIQNMAIDYIGQYSSNKNKSVAALSDLFSTIPNYRVEKQRSILWSIGEIGNRQAVDFLNKVAKTHQDYTLRSDAIYYLGNIGGDDARQALYEILKGK